MSPPPAPTTEVVVAGTVPAEQIERLRESFDQVAFEQMPREGPVPAGCRHAEVLFTVGQTASEFAAALTALPDLKWTHTASSGVDRFLPVLTKPEGEQDPTSAAVREPRVDAMRLPPDFVFTRTADARAVPMAEHVLALALALLKDVPELLERQRLREWRHPSPSSVAGSTVGVIGAGAVGRAVAQRFSAFGARTIGLKRSPQPLPEFGEVWAPERLHDLLAVSDVVVVTCPLTNETRNLIGAAEFSAMKSTAILVNVARGGIVVEPDLVAALQAGQLAGAAIDVFAVEPLPPGDTLWTLPNVIVTPHSASAGPPTVWEAVIDEFAANLQRFVAGLPLTNAVDFAGRGY